MVDDAFVAPVNQDIWTVPTIGMFDPLARPCSAADRVLNATIYALSVPLGSTLSS